MQEKKLWIEESHNCTEERDGEETRYRLGDSELYQAFTADIGKLFRSLQKEHGRCTSAVYHDREGQPPIRIGWYFQKLRKYTNCDKTYLHGVWITLHNAPPTKTITYHYHSLEKEAA